MTPMARRTLCCEFGVELVLCGSEYTDVHKVVADLAGEIADGDADTSKRVSEGTSK